MNHLTLTDSGSIARIAPDFGFNCFEFTAAVAGRSVEVLAAGPEFVLRGERPSRSGIPLLFPYPGRIRHGRFLWDGREYHLPPGLVQYNGDHAIHGFCLDRPWRVIHQTANSATGEFRFSTDDPERRDLWPADFILTVRYELLGPALRCDVTVLNPDVVPLPFGFGTHSYFRAPLSAAGRFNDCLVEAPTATALEVRDALPTGRPLPEHIRPDLSDGQPLRDLQLDDLYTNLSAEPQGIICRVVDPASGLQMVQTADASFKHLVAFTPWWMNAVCLEPYTCTPDAMNLQRDGIEAGLLVLPAGGVFKTFFELRVGSVVA